MYNVHVDVQMYELINNDQWMEHSTNNLHTQY
jgi:hypothetical protein